MMKKILLLTIVFSFIFLANVNAYQVTLYNTNASASTFSVSNPSIRSSGTSCMVFENSKTSLQSATNFDEIWNYYNPFTTIIATGEKLNVPNLTCYDTGLANGSTISSANTYQSRIDHTQTSSIGGYSTLKTVYNCTNPTNIVFFNYRRDNNSDTNGMYIGAYFFNASGTSSAYNKIINFNNACSNFNSTLATPLVLGGSSTNANTHSAYIYPFNTSYSGKVNLSYDLTNESYKCYAAVQTTNVTCDVRLFKMSDLSQTALNGGFAVSYTSPHTCPSAAAYSYQLSLASNSEYLFTFYCDTYGTLTNRGGVTTMFPNEVNISIDDRLPDWQCTAWSDCNNGTKTKYCNDKNGYFPLKIETGECFPETVAFQVLLDDAYSMDQVVECKKSFFTVPFCAALPQIMQVKVPQNWSLNTVVMNGTDTITIGGTIKYPHFVDMFPPCSDNPSDTNCIPADSKGRKTFGSLSTTIWSVPPNWDEPNQTTSSTITCANESVGIIPTLNNSINSTLDTNITINSTYMDLQFEVRSCMFPTLKYWDNACYAISATYGVPWKNCYSLNCNDTPSGYYDVRLVDTADNSTKMQYLGTATNDWMHQILDLSNLNLNISRTYTLQFATTNNFDVYSRYADCIALDNVTLNQLSSQLAIVCQTGLNECDGTDLLVPEYASGICTIKRYFNHSFCWSQFVLNTTSSTSIGNNNLTGGVFQPVALAETYLNSSANAMGYPQILFFFSPFMLSTYAILILALVIELAVDKAGGKAGGKVFMITLLLGSLALIGAGIYPIYLGLIYIILAGFLVARFVNQHINGGGD